MNADSSAGPLPLRPAAGPPAGRFAPSPTGPLHDGSLLAALGSWLFARRAGGAWRIRIEDLDPPREVPGMAERQLADLAAFGLSPDGEVLWQSTRHAAYAAALGRLVASGEAFECRCTRADLAAAGGVHRGCVARPQGRVPAWRLRAPAGTVRFDDAVRGPQQADLAGAGDPMLKRSDGLWAYPLAVVVDDAAQGITQVVRGADLLDATPSQLLLQSRLGLPSPGYAHLPLLRQPDGRKLSKSLGSDAVDPRDPLPALRRAWARLGQAPGPFAAGPPARALAAALDAFDPARIPPVDAALAAD